MDDLWVLEFSKRVTPKLRELANGADNEMPAMLIDRLDRLRQTEIAQDKRSSVATTPSGFRR